MTALHVILTMLLAVSPSARPVPLRVILTMILVRISIHKAKNGTDAKGPSVPIFAYSAQRFLGTRSRTGALRDDRRGAHQGILTKLLVKIFVYIAKNGTLSYS